MADMEDRNKEDNNLSNDNTNSNSSEAHKTDVTNDNKLQKIVNFSLKLIIIGLTAIYLLYEAIELIKLYHNYDTVVAVYYESPQSNQIPSFTICLPTIIDRTKLLVKYPDLKPKLASATSEEHQKNILTEYLDLALDSLIWTELTVDESQAFNCTLNYWSIKSNVRSLDYSEQIGLNCRDVDKPIESFSNTKAKCFTYFSQLNNNNPFNGDYSLRYGTKNLNELNELLNIEFVLDFDRYLTFGFIENETTIAIHQPKMIGGEESDTQVLAAGHQYQIIINKITTKLMEKPYKTNCFNYEKNGNGIQSRRQCIDNCVLELYKDKCNCIPIHLTNTLQLLSTSSPTVCSRRDSSLRSNDCYEDIGREVGVCLTSDRCPQSCQTIRYISRMRTKKLMTNNEEIDPSITSRENKVVISVRLDPSIGDTIETHVPVISFGQLLAYICAFLAIFIGLSFVELANLIIDKIPAIPSIPHFIHNTKIRDEESGTGSIGHQIGQKAKWLVENRGSVCIGSTKAPVGELAGSRRPATSAVYHNQISTTNVVDVRAQDK